MSPEKNKELVERYPVIFSKTKDISVGDGWYDIIDALCQKITSEINNAQSAHDYAVKHNTMLEAALAGDRSLFDAKMSRMDDEWKEKSYQAMLEEGPRSVPATIKPVVALQVKEKFGALRFYITGGNQTIWGMLDLAESMSVRTCEECGCPGFRGNAGWIRTLCALHHVQQTPEGND